MKSSGRYIPVKPEGNSIITLRNRYRTAYILVVFFLSTFTFIFGENGLYADTSNTGELKRNSVLKIQIDGTINPATVDYIRTAINKADAQNSDALLILLNTPGGLLTSTQDIVRDILNSPVPVIVYVYPKGASATSAGVFITLSANIAAMSPGTSIGAAAPVTIGRGEPSAPRGDDEEPARDVMGEKMENFAAAFIESIAEERGRNVEWAADAVRKSASITAQEALEIKVVDIIAPNIRTLLNDIDGAAVNVKDTEVILQTRDADTEMLEMSLKQKIVNIISTPDIAFLLLSLGSLGILLEFYNPGLIFPGVAGLIALLIGFVSLQILPFNYGGLALLFLGLALFVAEIYVTSYGLMSVGGLISFVFGALLLFDTPESDVGVGLEIIIATALALGLFFFLIIYSVSKSFTLPAQGGFEGLMNQEGEVISWDGNRGKVFVQGEYWDAYSDEQLGKGDRIRVVKSEGELTIKVSKI